LRWRDGTARDRGAAMIRTGHGAIFAAARS